MLARRGRRPRQNFELNELIREQILLNEEFIIGRNSIASLVSVPALAQHSRRGGRRLPAGPDAVETNSPDESQSQFLDVTNFNGNANDLTLSLAYPARRGRRPRVNLDLGTSVTAAMPRGRGTRGRRGSLRLPIGDFNNNSISGIFSANLDESPTGVTNSSYRGRGRGRRRGRGRGCGRGRGSASGASARPPLNRSQFNAASPFSMEKNENRDEMHDGNGNANPDSTSNIAMNHHEDISNYDGPSTSRVCSTTSSTLDNSNEFFINKLKRKSAKPYTFGEAKVRVGEEFQAECPDLLPIEERSHHEELLEPALCVWLPKDDLPAENLEHYLHMARMQYGYTSEQALGLLMYDKYDIQQAGEDLRRFTPTPDEWSNSDKQRFEEALLYHGKNFFRIQQMMPHKSTPNLVNYYYIRKKLKYHLSEMDRRAGIILGQEFSDYESD